MHCAKRACKPVRGCVRRSDVVKYAGCQYRKLRQQAMISQCAISVHCLDLQHGDLIKVSNGLVCVPVEDHRRRDLLPQRAN